MHGGRGSTTHDLDFSENALGFKPEKAQISPQQKPKTAPPLPPHTSVIDPTFGHEITTWGGGTGEWPSDPATPSIPSIPIISGWLDKMALLGLPAS